MKFFSEFLEVTNLGTRLSEITFLRKTHGEFENLVAKHNIREIPDFAAISRSVESWKGILKKVVSALSTANGFNSDIEAYFNAVAPVPGAQAPEEGGEIPVQAVRGGLRDMLKSYDPEDILEEKSLIPGIKELARLILRAEDFIIVKESIARILDVRYDEFTRAKSKVEDITDLVQFGEVTTDQAKARCTSALNALDAVVLQTKYLYQAVPDEEIQSIVVINVGNFLNVSQFGALLGVLSTEEYREAARFVDTEIRDRIDIPELEEEFKKVRTHVSKFNADKAEDERREDYANRSVINLRDDIESVLNRVYNGPLELTRMKLTELQFLKEKIFECEKRLNELRNVTPKAKFKVKIRMKDSYVEELATNWLLQAGQDIVTCIGDLSERKKNEELKRKMELQTIERDAPMVGLPDLEKAADFIVWESSFTPLEKLYKESGMSDWRNRLRDKVKGSLKRPEDIKACKGLLTLKEVKAYLRTTFIKNHSLIHDLLEPINELKTPKSIKDSSENIQTVLKLVSLVKRRDLMEKVTEVHVDQIIKVTLLIIETMLGNGVKN